MSMPMASTEMKKRCIVKPSEMSVMPASKPVSGPGSPDQEDAPLLSCRQGPFASDPATSGHPTGAGQDKKDAGMLTAKKAARRTQTGAQRARSMKARAVQARALKTRAAPRAHKPVRSAGSTHQEETIDPVMGKRALGPWQGPFASDPATSGHPAGAAHAKKDAGVLTAKMAAEALAMRRMETRAQQARSMKARALQARVLETRAAQRAHPARVVRRTHRLNQPQPRSMN